MEERLNRARDFVNDFRKHYHKQFNFDRIIEDLEEAIEDFGIKVLYSDMSAFPYPDKISGYSRVNENGYPEIIVNGNHVEARRRFTMAHELGHIIMHWGFSGEKLSTDQVSIFRNSETEYSDEPIEIEANEFAAQLLAPLDVIYGLMPKNINDCSPIEVSHLANQLSEAFNISLQFARKQLRKLEDYENDE